MENKYTKVFRLVYGLMSSLLVVTALSSYWSYVSGLAATLAASTIGVYAYGSKE